MELWIEQMTEHIQHGFIITCKCVLKSSGRTDQCLCTQVQFENLSLSVLYLGLSLQT